MAAMRVRARGLGCFSEPRRAGTHVLCPAYSELCLCCAAPPKGLSRAGPRAAKTAPRCELGAARRRILA